jgi:[ribosomal protein S18]-alanine N-acetyltransferase
VRELAPTLQLRRMTLADLDRVMALENQAFSNPWSRQLVANELEHEWSTVLLAEEPGPAGPELKGFAIFWLVADELHVLNVAVDARFRRQGLGRTLMDAVLATGRQRACRIANLEVRRGNRAAIALYESLGFRAVGMRPAYYQDDREDAVVMILDLYPTSP